MDTSTKTVTIDRLSARSIDRGLTTFFFLKSPTHGAFSERRHTVELRVGKSKIGAQLSTEHEKRKFGHCVLIENFQASGTVYATVTVQVIAYRISVTEWTREPIVDKAKRHPSQGRRR